MLIRVSVTERVNWSFWKRIKESCSLTLKDAEAAKLTEEEISQVNSILENVVGELAKVEAHFKAAKARVETKKQEKPKQEKKLE
jgi:hypothetical protein